MSALHERGAPGAEVLLGESPPMRALRREIAAVAPLGSTVLLSGETGAGKGLVAREIHRRSRRGGPLAHVDCAALAPTLVESELFGHERGAFTGAVADRAGRLERAAGGTLFLDEIGELGPPLQSKLLRVLQERHFERIGGAVTLAMRARVIAATSRDLRREVEGGRFRADLYFRLAVVCLRVPPLRERGGDLELLTRHLLSALAAQTGLPPPSPTGAFFGRLSRHSWPGNVRELQNALERLLIRYPGRSVDAADLDGILEEGGLPAGWAGAAPARDAPPTDAEIASALREAGGNVARAARRLGLPRTTLRRRLARLEAE